MRLQKSNFKRDLKYLLVLLLVAGTLGWLFAFVVLAAMIYADRKRDARNKKGE